MTDLQLLPQNKYDEVGQLLRSAFPRSYKLYNLLKRKLPKEVYAKIENGRIDASVLAIKVLISNPPLVCIWAPNCLQEVLKKNPVVDWTFQSAILFDITEDEVALYETIAKEHGGSLKVHIDDGFALDSSRTIKEVRIPEQLFIRPVLEEDAELIHSTWEYRNRISFADFQILLRDCGGGFILIEKDSNQAISWILMNDYGGIGCLKTLEEHRRKGYGSLMATYLSQHMIKLGLIPLCHINVDNLASRSIFEKIGFRPFIRNYWLTYLPPQR